MKKIGFTLAEVLITLAIIGVVAAISIPSVVANTQQKEFQTGLRKAVSVLNSAITMNMALEGETPYDNKNIYYYLQRHMSVMKKDVASPTPSTSNSNYAFYTTDGMRFEAPYYVTTNNHKLYLYENSTVFLRGIDPGGSWKSYETADLNPMPDCPKDRCGSCGSYGLVNNTDNTIYPPCLIVVDVNGDRKPFPQNASCHRNGATCRLENVRKYGDPNGVKLTDTFSIMITDKQAIPYGQAAQKAMYQAQSKGKK